MRTHASVVLILQAMMPPVLYGVIPCDCGEADVYDCHNVDMLARVTVSELGGPTCNDLWGWTDSETGKEYALVGLNVGTSFVDITDPENPIVLGNLPCHAGSVSTWRDIKTYANHAYIVSESNAHGMQVFDLTQLRNVDSPPVTFTETAHYNGFSSAHNLVINEESGFAYAVGTNTCSAGLHMIDLQSPTSPTAVGCFSADGYTHDAQCVNYHGPDVDYAGREICFCANEDTLTIVDVTNKNNPVQVARQGYAGSGYAHQGWLTEDHSHFLMGDELDEFFDGIPTTTYLWNVSDLDSPIMFDTHRAATAATDHNLYVKGQFVYQANYRAGLRILDLSQIGVGELTEVGFFDVYPINNNAGFEGAWSVYPYFESGVIIVSSRDRGLFAVRANLAAGFAGEPAVHFAACLTGAGGIRTSDCGCVDYDFDADVDLADAAAWMRSVE